MKLIWLFLLPWFVFGTASQGLFKKFPNRYFVETGSYEGDGIAQALSAGFAEVHSIELSDTLYRQCQERFAAEPKVHLWHGDSGVVLKEAIAKIDGPITFWLDGHFSYGKTAKGKTNTPLLHELEIIKNHPVKNHTILIDDVRLFGSESFDFIQMALIQEKIKEINSQYRIRFEKGFQSNDILVAEIVR